MASAMRSMFKGVIQFGLVTVPCKLFLAVDPHTTGMGRARAPVPVPTSRIVRGATSKPRSVTSTSLGYGARWL